MGGPSDSHPKAPAASSRKYAVGGFVEPWPGTKKCELQLDISPSRLAVTLAWHGPVLDGLLTSMIRASEVLWVIEREGKDGAGGPCSLSMVLPKTKASYWRSLFEGSEMRSHWEVGRDVALIPLPCTLSLASANAVCLAHIIGVHRHKYWIVSAHKCTISACMCCSVQINHSQCKKL